MDPLPSKMPKKPRSETPIDYTGKPTKLTCEIQQSITIEAAGCLSKMLGQCNALRRVVFSCGKMFLCVRVAVQIPPSTAYAPPMKRPIEEEEGTDDKSPNKKKKKLQKKCM